MRRVVITFFWVWLVAAFLLNAPALAAPAPPRSQQIVVLRDTTKLYPLGWHWSILTDDRPGAEAHPLTLAQVQAPPYLARFVPSTEAFPNRETQPADYWLRCQVRNAGHATTGWLFVAALSNASAFELIVLRDDGQINHQLVDEEHNWAESHAVPGRAQNVNLALVPGHTYTLYVHIRNELFWFVIMERTHFLQINNKGSIEGAAYFGLMLGLLVYNLLLFFSVRDRSYFYYVLFTLFFALLQAHMMGYLTQFWLHRYSPFVQDATQHLLLGLTIAASVQTARSFLETRRLMPRYDRVLRWALLLSVLPVLGVWFNNTPLHYGPQIAPLAICAVLLLAGVKQLFAGYRPARYFMAGWTVLMVAIVVYYLRTLGVLPVSIFTEYGVRVASALEIILLSLGLADRINLTRQERHEAQQQVLVTLREKEEVQEQANLALTQRAAELQSAYAELQESLKTTGRLQEIDELKTRFFTNISHELRTPLTLILAPLEEMMTGQSLQDPAANHTLMHRHANRLLALINQLLDVARLEAGQMRLTTQNTDLHTFIQLRVGVFASTAAQRNVRLELIAAELPPSQPLYTDTDQLEKILDNLLSNALKFTPSGESIKVGLAFADGYAEIRVADTGIGIAAAHLPHLFDRFYQADDSLQRQHEGSGIGLALVKELTELHHGNVSVSSAEGVGTAFVVRLPLGTAHLRPDEIRESPVVASARSQVQREEIPALPLLIATAELPLVMVIDDHDDLRDYVSRCLSAECRILTAADGEAGLALIAAEMPDLVVSDLMMPHMDGLELCRRIKTDERTSHIPVVLLTARTSEESRLEGLELGADDYLIKPFRPAELQARVRNLLRQRLLLRQRFAQEITLQPRDISITPADEIFLNRVMGVAETHLANPNFDVESFASALAMSRIQLYRKLKALTDQSPTDFMRVLRLRRAAQLLAGQAGTVADIAYAVGFNNLSYFSKCFREQFGHVPSEHLAHITTV